MNEKVLILLNTTILTENTELGDEGGEDKKTTKFRRLMAVMV